MSEEDKLIRKIKGGISGIKLGTKDPQTIFKLLQRLQAINDGMYQDLLKEYIVVVKSMSNGK